MEDLGALFFRTIKPWTGSEFISLARVLSELALSLLPLLSIRGKFLFDDFAFMASIDDRIILWLLIF